jgi:hypothetical protein
MHRPACDSLDATRRLTCRTALIMMTEINDNCLSGSVRRASFVSWQVGHHHIWNR